MTSRVGEPAIAISEEGPARKSCIRTLHKFEIKGVALLAYDDCESQAADRVAEELLADIYGLDAIPFQPGDVVIDIGAHVGMVSMYLAKRWPFLRIDAFEPYRPNYENCSTNLHLNNVSNVRLFKQAVTVDGRSLILRCLPSNTGGATAVFELPGAQADTPVDSTTLPDILERALAPGQRCRLLKIDCEGMEYEILSHSSALDRVDFLAAEFHEGTLYSRDVHCDVNNGAARTLFDFCARSFPPERMRVVFCPKCD